MIIIIIVMIAIIIIAVHLSSFSVITTESHSCALVLSFCYFQRYLNLYSKIA